MHGCIGPTWVSLQASSEPVRSEAGLKAHVCLPGSASPPACRGPATPPACRGRSSSGNDRQRLAPRLPDRPLCATEPARRAHSCKAAPRVGQETRHLRAATRPKPDRPDNPNRPVSILSNSEPALCALGPAPSHQAAPVPRPSPGCARTCRRARVATATPKPARRALRLAVFSGRNYQHGEPPPLHAFRHFDPSPPALLPAGAMPKRSPGDRRASSTTRPDRLLPPNPCSPAHGRW